VERRPAPGSTALFLAGGRHFRSPGNITLGGGGRFERIAAKARLLPVALQKRRFEQRTDGVSMASLNERPVGDYLETGTYSTWLRMLLMYAYSTPYPETAAIPAVLAVPVLRAFTHSAKWTAIRGGAWEYLRRIIEAANAKIVLDARIDAISRPPDAVEVRLQTGEVQRFDAVVLAAPPDQVLALLLDPTPAETRRFSAWRANRIETVVHTDTGAYERRGIRYFSEFDLFEGPDGSAGYNAYLNRLSGLPPGHPTHYFLSYGLDHEIDPACVVHKQPHHSPRYTAPALRHREEVLETQGERRTFHAGAWLGNGLHEGAVASASEVSQRLGGRGL
jgi:predicted NAD/FAD-binding protein